MGTNPEGHDPMTAIPETTACPRCRHHDVRQVAVSPVPGRWVMRAYQACWYVWRSTEPATATDPGQYPEPFRLDPGTITAAPGTV